MVKSKMMMQTPEWAHKNAINTEIMRKFSMEEDSESEEKIEKREEEEEEKEKNKEEEKEDKQIKPKIQKKQSKRKRKCLEEGETQSIIEWKFNENEELDWGEHI